MTMIDIRYQFRDPNKSREFEYLHPHLRRFFLLVCHVVNDMEFDVLITSMVRPKGTITGESGVHATGRALDCIPMAREKIMAQELDKKMVAMCDSINELYPRKDGYDIIKWHEVPGGGGLHLHLQVPWTEDFVDLKGSVPKTDA